MPDKQNSAGRHHIPKMRHSVTNWREYEDGLRRRGKPDDVDQGQGDRCWRAAPRKAPGGQSAYSDSAIQTCLMLHATFKLRLRQVKGLMYGRREIHHSLDGPWLPRPRNSGRKMTPSGGASLRVN